MEENNVFLNEQQEMPTWLKNYKMGKKININSILKNRLVYYPGSFVDIHPVIVFNELNSVHTYLYVDYGHKKEDIIAAMKNEVCERLYTYDIYDVCEFNINDIEFEENTPHFFPNDKELELINSFSQKEEYGLLFVFERNVSDEKMPERFAIIYLCSDGITFYDKFFQNHKSLYALVIQDHGFGGNYNSFGARGAMYKIAKSINVFPKYILCATNSKLWNGYREVYADGILHTDLRERYIYQII